MAGRQHLERVGDEPGDQSFDGRHGDVSAHHMVFGVEFRAQVGDALLAVVGERQDAVPGRGERHPAGPAGEQAHPELVFEQADLAADGAGRDEQVRAGPRHRPGEGDFAEVAQRG